MEIAEAFDKAIDKVIKDLHSCVEQVAELNKKADEIVRKYCTHSTYENSLERQFDE